MDFNQRKQSISARRWGKLPYDQITEHRRSNAIVTTDQRELSPNLRRILLKWSVTPASLRLKLRLISHDDCLLVLHTSALFPCGQSNAAVTSGRCQGAVRVGDASVGGNRGGGHG